MRLLLVLFVLCAYGCSDELGISAEDSEIAVSLTADPTYVSRNSSRPSTYADTKQTSAPDVQGFHIEIQNAKGSTIKEWDRYADMPQSVRLREGSYFVRATYGDSGVTAFDSPSYEGLQAFNATQGSRDRLSVTCYVSNVKVLVTYTEGFQKYFKDWNTTAKTTGSELAFVKGETRGAYMPVGDISTKISMTNRDGKVLTFSPAVITGVKARDEYRLKFDVADGAGGVHLLVSFDKITDDKPIDIDLSSAWSAGDTPFFTASGFTLRQPIRIIEGDEADVSMLVTARGEIASYKIATTSSQLLERGFPQSGVDLVDINDANKTTLKDLGLKWTEGLKGINMAIVDFSKITSQLKTGNAASTNHNLTLQVRDKLGQLSVEMPVTFTIVRPALELLPPDEVLPNSIAAELVLDMPYGNINKITVERRDGYGIWHTTPHTLLRADVTRYTISAAANFSTTGILFRVRYNGTEILSNPVMVNVELPEYSILSPVAADAWSNQAFVNVELPEDGIAAELKLQYQNGSSWLPLTSSVVSSSNGVARLKVTGLTPAKNYVIRAVYAGAKNSENNISITTESTPQITNPGFEDINSTPYFNTSINKGGRYGGGFWSWKQDTQTLTVNETQNWATTNSKTLPLSPKTKNTWYMVPSVMLSSGRTGTYSVTLRSVAWDNNADTPPQGSTSIGGQSITDLNPPTINCSSAGKLFLGSYSCVHNSGASGVNSENYNYGIPFVSRPAKLRGFYKYAPAGSDRAEIVVRVENRTGGTTVLASTTINPSSTGEWSQFELPLAYTNTSLKATHLVVIFSSSTAADGSVPLNEKDKSNCIQTGSELTIDDIELVY